MTLTWEAPAAPTGTIKEYKPVIKMTEDPFTAEPCEFVGGDSTLLTCTASTLKPLTSYDVSVQACGPTDVCGPTISTTRTTELGE